MQRFPPKPPHSTLWQAPRASTGSQAGTFSLLVPMVLCKGLNQASPPSLSPKAHRQLTPGPEGLPAVRVTEGLGGLRIQPCLTPSLPQSWGWFLPQGQGQLADAEGTPGGNPGTF